MDHKIQFTNHLLSKETDLKTDFNLDFLSSRGSDVNIKLEKTEKEEKVLLCEAIKYLIGVNILFTINAIIFRSLSNIMSDRYIMLFTSVRHFLTLLLCNFYSKIKKYPLASLYDFSKGDGSNIIGMNKYTNSEYFRWIVVRVFSYTMSLTLAIYSLQNLKLGLANLIVNIGPLITNILAVVFLGEPIKIKYLISCIMSFIGIYIMVINSFSNEKRDVSNNIPEGEEYIIQNYTTHINNKESDYSNNEMNFTLGLITGLINCLLISFIYLTAKIMSSRYNAFNVMYITSFYSFIFGGLLCYSIYDFSELSILLNPSIIMCEIISGTIVVICFAFIQKGVEKVDINKVSYVFYLQVPMAVLVGLFVYGESILWN